MLYWKSKIRRLLVQLHGNFPPCKYFFGLIITYDALNTWIMTIGEYHHPNWWVITAIHHSFGKVCIASFFNTRLQKALNAQRTCHSVRSDSIMHFASLLNFKGGWWFALSYASTKFYKMPNNKVIFLKISLKNPTEYVSAGQ